MKVDLFKCDRCDEQIEVEGGKQPITITHVDGRFSNDKPETLHFCGDCYITFLYTIDTKKERREAFNKVTDKFYKEDQKDDS